MIAGIKKEDKNGNGVLGQSGDKIRILGNDIFILKMIVTTTIRIV